MDLTMFAAHHKADGASGTAALRASTSSSFDWDNDLLVNELLAL
jgi:hypothetical protein